MTYINFVVHDHIQEFIKENGFRNCYQFWTDPTMVFMRMRKLLTNNKNLVFLLNFRRNNSLSYQFKIMDCETVM